MATVTPTSAPIVGSTRRVTWGPLTSTDTAGLSIAAPDHTFKEIQVKGTFDSSTVTIEGTLDPESVADGSATWATLNDVQGNALTFTTARMERVQESVARIRPNVSSAGASTSVTVTMVMKTHTVLS